MRLSRRYIVLLVILAAALVGLGQFITYQASLKNLTVNYKNVKSVKIYDATNAIETNQLKLVKEGIADGENIKLKEGFTYKAVYEGNDGYESGEKIIDASSQDALTIDPAYSREKLDEILSTQLNQIHQVISARYNNISLYQIQKGQLFEYGDWYGTTLKYVGSDPYNSDTLRIVLKHQDGKWEIKTDPPSITLSKYIFTDVPEEILRKVNSL